MFLTLLFTGLICLESTSQAYWVDKNGNEHYGVVTGAADTSADIVSDTGYAIGDIFGAHRYHGPSDHFCRHHPSHPDC